MKKLMTMLAAAAMAFGLYAADDGFISGTAFEANAGADESYDGSALLPTYWGTFGEQWGTIPAGVTEVKDSTIAYATGTHKVSPAKFKDNDNQKSLFIKTTLNNPIAQRVQSNGQPKDLTGGLYFDGFVNMTVFDEVPGEYPNAKIAVYLLQTNEEDSVKFIVRAKNGGTVKDFECLGGASGIAGDEWHRLTIKTIADIGTGSAGFVIFVDGIAVNCTAAKLPTDDLNLVALNYNENGKLFLPLAETTGIAGVEFDGQGWVDELVFTTTAPTFAADPQVAELVFDTEKGANFKYSLDGEEWNDATSPLKFGEGAIAIPEDGKVWLKWDGSETYCGNKKQYDIISGTTTTVPGSDYTAAEASFGGVGYSLADAIIAANNAETAGMIKLLTDLTADEGITIEKAGTTLDLNGTTFTGDIASGDEEVDADIVLVNNGNGDAVVAGAYTATGTIQGSNIKFAYDDNTKPMIVPAECGIVAKLDDDYEFTADAEDPHQYWLITEKKVAQVGTTTYPSIQAAVTANKNKDSETAVTITLVAQDATVEMAGFDVDAGYATKGLIIDLNGCSVVFNKGCTVGNEVKTYPIRAMGNQKLTIQNGSISLKSGYTPHDIVRDYSASLTFNNLGVNGTGLTTSGTDCAAVIRSLSGSVDFIGSTSIIAGEGNQIAWRGDYTVSGYTIGTMTFNTTGTISGGLMLYGGSLDVTNIGTDNIGTVEFGATGHSTWADAGDLSGYFAARIGEPVASATGVAEKNVKGGNLYKTVADAEAAAQTTDTITLVKAFDLDGTDKTFACNVAVANGAKVTLGEKSLTIKGDGLDAAADFTDSDVEKTDNDDGTFTYAVKAADTPVEPGEEVEVVAEDADKAAAAVEAKKDKLLVVPGTVKLEGAALTAYQALFAAKAEETGTPGTYNVKFELTAAAESEIKGELNQAAGEQSILTPDGNREATLVAKPGLFYGVAGADNLTLGSENVTEWVQAESTTVKVKVPTVTGDKAFFKPICSAVAK